MIPKDCSSRRLEGLWGHSWHSPLQADTFSRMLRPDSAACTEPGRAENSPEVQEEVKLLELALAWAGHWCLQGSQEHWLELKWSRQALILAQPAKSHGYKSTSAQMSSL